jgi:hypothetical protein
MSIIITTNNKLSNWLFIHTSFMNEGMNRDLVSDVVA